MNKYFFLFSLFCWVSIVFAQKPSLDHEVYDTWESINGVELNQEGSYVLFSIMQQQGDARLIISESTGKRLWDIPRGVDARFIENTPFVIFSIKPRYADTRQAKIDKKKKEDLPKDSLGLVNLETMTIHKWGGVRLFKLPEKGSSYIGFLSMQEPDTAFNSDGMDENEKRQARYNLHIRDLEANNDQVIDNVDDFYFNETGDKMVFIRNAKETSSDSSGLYWVDLRQEAIKRISTGKGTYSHISFDSSGQQLAFTAEKSPEKSLLKPYALYYYKGTGDSAQVIAHAQSRGLPPEWEVSGHAALKFSADGKKLFFGIAPIPSVRDTNIVDFEVAKLDIWHWQDDYLQPQQLLNRKRDMHKSYLAVLDLDEPERLIPLGSLKIPNVYTTEDATEPWVLGISDMPYRMASQWKGKVARDIYLISTKDGEKKPVATGLYAYPYMDPKGRHIIWFDEQSQQWTHYDVLKGKTLVLNIALDVPFGDEDLDQPTLASAYGMAGWDTNGEGVYIYDKYDIWYFNLQDHTSENITKGLGRKTKVTFRYLPLDWEKRHLRIRPENVLISSKMSLVLSAFNHKDKTSGMCRLSSEGQLEVYDMHPYRYAQVGASQNQNVFVYTKENYKASPDVYISKDFKEEVKLSEINPQQQLYNWGDVELVHWTTPKGYEASGLLYKPDDFDSSKQYPMIVYFYEKVTDGLYAYIPPTPTPSRLNISYFVSNGYLVFTPDIEYEIGYPGRSAEEFVNSGVKHLAENSWLDTAHIGIQGQSWGGYQIAHIITRTDMYAAAWTGAPVVNMTSAYGGIRWASGRNRQFQYEHTQSRIGKDLWSGLDLYMENSPLFHLKEVQTPVVIMANDADGAVPWYQGIEMFTALRRLQKPVWMLNYNGEAHNLVERQNKKDIQRRQQQFFDHYLKGAPAPKWLASGVPATLKGIDWGFELVQ